MEPMPQENYDPWPLLTDDPVDFRFENDFVNCSVHFQPDNEYIQHLEQKLKKLKTGPQSDRAKRRQLVDQLCEARKECLERLVNSSNDIVFENEQLAVKPMGLTVWINPEQPLSTTETQKLIEEDPQDE